jgi:hypothetical protein
VALAAVILAPLPRAEELQRKPLDLRGLSITTSDADFGLVD